MKKLIFCLLLTLFSTTAFAQFPNLPMIRSAADVVLNPQITWTEPTSDPTFQTSVRDQFFAGAAAEGSATLISISISCTGATSIGASAFGLATWRYPETGTINLAVGTTNCIVTVLDDNGRTGQASKQFIIINPDTGPPTVDAGIDASTAATTFNRSVDCVDDVECDSVTWSGLGGTDVPCTMQGNGAVRTADCLFVLVATNGLTTANTITVTGIDAALQEDDDTVIITRTVALSITTSSISSCVEDVVCPAKPALIATGGTTGTYTFDNNGAGTTLNDSDTDCTGMVINSAGVISGTPNPPSAPATCSFVARVDDTVTTATRALTLSITAAGAEVRQTYFEWHANTNGDGSGRSMCAADNTGTDCILRFDAAPDATYGDNGAVRFSEDLTAPITMTVALAKAQIAALMSGSPPLDNEMGTKQSFTFSYADDPYADKQLGAKVIIAGNVFGDGLCDDGTKAPAEAGCPGMRGDENVELTFSSINIGGGGTGTVTFVVDDFFTDGWNSNGINALNEQGEPTGTKVVSSCPGGKLGTRNMRKQYRIDTIGKAIWLAQKTDLRQANADTYFKDPGSVPADNNGFWDCDDNIIAVTATTGQNSETKSFSTTLVSLKTMGIVDYDGGTKPSGKGTFALRTNNYDFPIMHSRWNRRIIHIEYGVSANDPIFDDWRDDCDQRDRVSTVGSFVPGAANDQSAIQGTADFKCAGMLTNDPATAGEAGECATKLTNLALCSIADQDSNCRAVALGGDPELCTSKWAAISTWFCDEVRGCQRTAWRVPWWQVSPDDGAALLMRTFFVEYDSSTPACTGCEDAIFYQGPVFGIVNIDPNDIDDTGCPSACLGADGATPALATNPNSVFRKPVR